MVKIDATGGIFAAENLPENVSAPG